MKSDYESSKVRMPIYVILMFMSMFPGFFLIVHTCYPLFNNYPEMMTIIVATKRCFWICVTSFIASFIMFYMYMQRAWKNIYER